MEIILKADGASGEADLFIDANTDSISLCVLTDKKDQFDFSIEVDEWDAFKNYIETKIKDK